MPRYFFDTSSSEAIRDETGMELVNDDAAKIEALHRAAWFACDAENLEKPGAIIVAVRGKSGARILTVRLVCSTEME